ncbi:MAG: hypothetical protein LLG09_01120 [Negativicutes bacterium]|nr:hypothetical protein [Negativicutes bacterium]
MKFIRSSKRMLSTALIMLLAFLVALTCLVAPVERKRNAVSVQAALTEQQMTAYSLAVSYFRSTQIALQLNNLSLGDKTVYRELSGMMAKVTKQLKFERLYLLYRSGADYYYLADQAYRDNGTAGIDYFDFSISYLTGIYGRECRAALEKVLSSKSATFVNELLANGNVINYLPIFDENENVIAFQAVETKLSPDTFNRLGFFNLYILSGIFAVISLGCAVYLYFCYKRASKQNQTPPAAQEKTVI